MQTENSLLGNNLHKRYSIDMKINQTQDTLTIEKSGTSAILLGVVVFIIGSGAIIASQLNMGAVAGNKIVLTIVGAVFAIAGLATFFLASSMQQKKIIIDEY